MFCGPSVKGHRCSLSPFAADPLPDVLERGRILHPYIRLSNPQWLSSNFLKPFFSPSFLYLRPLTPFPPPQKKKLSREQTGFVEGVWKERRRLESELDARREEVERLRASEDAARTAAAVLDGKVEDMSAALKQEKARAKREAEAAVTAEARDAMEALRRQLDDLRKEVDRTKQLGQDQARDGGSGGGGARGRGSNNPDGAVPGFLAAEDGAGPRGGGRKGEYTTAAVGVTAPPSSPPSLAVLEGEFQRLRAKYEKAKGRIVALEELVAASRRVGGQARREFQVFMRQGRQACAYVRTSRKAVAMKHSVFNVQCSVFSIQYSVFDI